MQDRINELMKYNPNDDEDLSTLWGTYSSRRRNPRFRYHTDHAQAVDSVRKSRDATGSVYFYCNGTGRWELHEVWVDGKELYR